MREMFNKNRKKTLLAINMVIKKLWLFVKFAVQKNKLN